jgi:glucosamine--fructose-6-phosphate aminotransferase (isomerizing)
MESREMRQDPVTNAYVADILSQPSCLRRVGMDQVKQAVGHIDLGGHSRVVLSGMGSSHAALRPLWLSLLKAGRAAWLVDAAECLEHFERLVGADTLVIVASQSGRSAEIVALCGLVRSAGGTILGVTNDTDSPLARDAHAVVDIAVGVENAVSTKTYLNTLAIGAALGGIFAEAGENDAIPRAADALEAYFEGWQDRLAQLKAAVGLPQRLFFLARGASLAAAQYGALIAKEAARWPAEAQSAPQFRHGPLELADERLTTVVLAGTDPTARGHNRALHDDLVKLGATSFWLDAGHGEPFSIPGTVPAETRPIVEAVPLQLLSVALAELSGIRPGEFRHLKKVTTVL